MGLDRFGKGGGSCGVGWMPRTRLRRAIMPWAPLGIGDVVAVVVLLYLVAAGTALVGRERGGGRCFPNEGRRDEERDGERRRQMAVMR